MYEDSLYHHGILGQKWGVRRFENAQGRLTPAGLKRYADGRKVTAKEQHAFSPKAAGYKAVANAAKSVQKSANKKAKAAQKEADKEKAAEKKGLTDKQKKMIIAGAAVAGTALAAYGGYKLYQLNKEAKEGLSNEYHQKAVNEFVNARKLDAKYYDDRSAKTFNAAADARDRAEILQGIAKSGKFSVGEKASYLKLQKAKASANNNDQLKAKKEVTKVRKQYAKDQQNWYRKTVNLEQQKAFAERLGDTKTAAKIDKKLASSPPPLPPSASKKGVAATNKLASEASSLAKSVTAAGPKSFSKPAQNASQTKSQMTQQKLQSVSKTISSGSKSTSNVVKLNGSQKFSQAAKTNDDYVSQMLKRNSKSLSQFSMKDLSDLDLY